MATGIDAGSVAFLPKPKLGKSKPIVSTIRYAKTRQRFWPMKGKIIARRPTGIRAKSQLLERIMGDLPADPIEPARPLFVACVAFCGPVWIHCPIRRK